MALRGSFFFPILLVHHILLLPSPSLERRVPYGPTVDPGVFVITQVDTCRGGKGYCILGLSCEVDKDFLADDLGGNCDGLTEAFYPSAKFTCCRENPANAPKKEVPTVDKSNEAVVLESKEETTTENSETTTEIVTEVVTETYTEKVVQEVTDVQMVTEITQRGDDDDDVIETEVGSNIGVKPAQSEGEGEVLRPGVVIDVPIKDVLEGEPSVVDSGDGVQETNNGNVDLLLDEGKVDVVVTKEEEEDEDVGEGKDAKVDVNCQAALLFGIKCEMLVSQPEKQPQQQPKKALRKATPGKPDEDVGFDESSQEDSAADGVIKTTKIDFEPERDELLDMVAKNRPKTTTTSTTTEESSSVVSSSFRPSTEDNKSGSQDGNVQPELNCGRLGGQGVIDAFGRAAEGLLPDLVANWVTGHPSHKMASEYIGGGAVTSTVIYCWMAAVVKLDEEKKDNDNADDEKEFVCTGSLVQRDLVVTSASCAVELLKNGFDGYNVIAGDSNLNIDLPFGVQTIPVSQVFVHEDFSSDSGNNIGLIVLSEPVELTKTVCLLCLPEKSDVDVADLEARNCTAVSYGKRVQVPQEEAGSFRASPITDDSVGILRTSRYPILDRKHCPGSEKIGALLCSGHEDGEKGDVCKVALDVGSPVVCASEDGRHELTAMLTASDVCARDQRPKELTNVAEHLEWIADKYETER